MLDFADIRADFEFLDEWDDRYKYIIDLGRNIAPILKDIAMTATKYAVVPVRSGCTPRVIGTFSTMRAIPDPTPLKAATLK